MDFNTIERHNFFQSLNNCCVKRFGWRENSFLSTFKHFVFLRFSYFCYFQFWNNSFIKLSKWEVPVQQLHEIYTEFYGYERISRAAIEECSFLLYLARLAEYFLSYNLYSAYYKQSPFLSEQLNDYYKGGINDMVAWTTQYFQLVTDMINKGTQICDFSDRREDMFDLRCNSTQTPFTKQRKIIGKRQERHRMENSNDVLVSDLV